MVIVMTSIMMTVISSDGDKECDGNDECNGGDD